VIFPYVERSDFDSQEISIFSLRDIEERFCHPTLLPISYIKIVKIRLG
jgi:hypothetical protein